MAEEKSTEEVKEPNPAPASYSRDVMKLVLNLIAFHIKYNFFVNLKEKRESNSEIISAMQKIVEKAVSEVADEIDKSEDATDNYFGRTGINKEKLQAIVHDVQLSLNAHLERETMNRMTGDEMYIIDRGDWWNLKDLVTPRYDKYNTLTDKICEILELLLFNDAYIKKHDAIRKLQQYRELWHLTAPLEAKYIAGVFDAEFILPNYSSITIEGRDRHEILNPGVPTLGLVGNPSIQQPMPTTGVVSPKQQ